MQTMRIPFITLAALAIIVLITTGIVFKQRLLLYSRTRPIKVTLCELNNDPARYDGTIVHITARLYSAVGGPFLYDEICIEHGNFPLLDVSEFHGLNPELKQWIRNIGTIDAPEEDLEAEVTVTGKFDASYKLPGEVHLSRHRYRIIPYTLEQNTPLSTRVR